MDNLRKVTELQTAGPNIVIFLNIIDYKFYWMPSM